MWVTWSEEFVISVLTNSNDKKNKGILAQHNITQHNSSVYLIKMNNKLVSHKDCMMSYCDNFEILFIF